MCDQSEVIYAPGDVVWVKLGPIWWPGQVFDYEKLPEEITSNLRKTPIAVVKFFQEESYEYVKNLNSIYHYNCRRKNEFIKKGLDVIRSNNRDVPSNMKMFPNDVATAEHLTHGDPNILDDEEFAPTEKEDYSELFGKKTPKRSKVDSKKDTPSWRLKPLSDSSAKANRHSLPTPLVPRPITHRRFITKALEGRSDHEVRIRKQLETDMNSPSKQYNCHLCGFSSSRINVIVLHNKSHSAGYADAYLHPQKLPSKGARKSKSDRKMTFGAEKRQRMSESGTYDGPSVAKKKSAKSQKEVAGNSSEILETNSKANESAKSTPGVKKPVFGKKKSAKDKAEKIAREKQQTDAFRENLLKDWDDEDFGNDEDKADNSMEESNERDSSSDSASNLLTQKSKSISNTKETSCFDFDDSDDGLNIGETVMKFGQKIPRVLGEKSKKHTNKSPGQSPSKEGGCNERKGSISEVDETNDISSDQQLPTVELTEEKQPMNENESDQKHNDLDNEFKSLLNETAVPNIPDAPTHLDVKKTLNLEEKSEHSEIDEYDVNDKGIDDGGGGQVEDGGGGGGCIDGDESSSKNIENISKDSEVSNDVQNKSDAACNKDESFSNAEHFLVKTSEEVATSSSDDVNMEEVSSPIGNNVALSSSESADRSYIEKSELSKMEYNSEVESVNVSAEAISKTDAPSASGELNTVDVQPNNVEEIEFCKVNDAKSKASSEAHIIDEPTKTETPDSLSVAKSEVNDLREMDFDINSMPVIIGDDMMEEQSDVMLMNEPKSISPAKLSSPVKTDKSSPHGNKLITVKTVPKRVTVDSVIGSSGLPIVMKDDVGFASQSTVVGKESRMPAKKLILSPTGTVATTRPTQVATIKVQPSTATAINKLSVPGMITQKGLGTTSQVLILKSTAPSGKSTLQKIGNTSQVIQQGGKVLILTNPQGVTSQNKIITQKSLSPSKLTATRILTTKGTVLTTASPTVVTKANILSGSSKTVTTKSGQKILINKGSVISQSPKSVIINKTGLLTAVSSPAVISGKSPLITQNILTSKPETITSHVNLSQITAGSSKGAAATNIITASGLTANNSMVLTPLTIGKNTPLTNSQKLKLITSKASPVATSSASGTKLLVQGTQSRVILPSLQKTQQLKFVGNLKNQQNTGTILIQTSQGVIATTPLSSGQAINKPKQALKSTPAILSPKAGSIQVSQAQLQPQNKFIVQKVKPGPNILQRTQKKPTQRNIKKSVPSSQLLTTAIASQQNLQTMHVPASLNQTISSPQETLLLSSASGLPVIGQSNVVSGTQLDSSNQTLVYLTVDESGNYRPLESTPVVNFEGATADSQTLYIDPGTTDLDNIFLAIDDAGNVVNITRPVSNTFMTENSTPTPSQDILAKALADTQVLQQETLISDSPQLATTVNSSVLGGCMFVEQPAQYPQPSLSHGVLETSLTLNQAPIMTPLEVPSAVSPRSLDQISSLQTGFLSDSGLLTPNKDKKLDVHPSMPLLTEDAECATSSKNETVFFTQVDGSHAVLTPVSSGSQLAFQLALDGNNVIVSSTPGLPSLGVISGPTMTQSAITSASQPDSQTITTTESPLISINDSEITPTVFSPLKPDSFQSTENLPEHDSSLVTIDDPSKNGETQNLVYDSSEKEDLHSSANIDDNALNTNVSQPNISTTGASSEIQSNSSTNDCDIETAGLTETTEPTIVEPYAGTEEMDSHQAVSVINRPDLENSKGETLIVAKDEAYATTMINVSFSNGEMPERIIAKRLSSDSSDVLVSDNVSVEDGIDCKRLKLEER